tara:strand:+ start:193 stop:540 length:348 start_codon:yes stop_codon:yes gene_type:complete
MIIRALDADGDWTFGKGLSNYASNNAGIEQNIKTRYNEWVGDCFFNSEAGIDWSNRLGYGSKDVLENDIKSLIAKSYGVVSVESLSSQLVGRKFTASYSVKTIFSETITGNLGNG